ncbi:hypothetical protein BGZ99_008150 [Dissophora globulifera]|uniref:Crinkler effector protein N-terminal domain-containing protein n=1 Tax=Dissophora globulifera TaxID=979702 RepID=A0A9P6RCH6_9FUNG|nr:hypothetical protein BGZ99_008150 [Dissophora globulifera]
MFCLVEGESAMNAFSVSVDEASTVADLKDLIKAKKPIAFANMDASEIVLWSVYIPVSEYDKRSPVHLRNVDIKDEPLPTEYVSDIFCDLEERGIVHVLVQKPISGNALTCSLCTVS